MFYRHVFDKISTEFHGILRVFVNFAALRQREISEALTTSCVIYIIQTGDYKFASGDYISLVGRQKATRGFF